MLANTFLVSVTKLLVRGLVGWYFGVPDSFVSMSFAHSFLLPFQRRRYLSRFPRGQVEVESGENVSQVSHARSTTGLVSQASRRDRGEAMQMAEVQTTTTRRNQVHSAIEEWAAAMSDMAARQQAAISNSDRKERSVTSVVPMQHFEQFMKEQEERSWQPLIHEYEVR